MSKPNRRAPLWAERLAVALTGMAAIVAASLATGCDGCTPSSSSDSHASRPGGAMRRANKPLVAVSVEPLAYFVERIGSPAVRVVSIIPPGAAHTFEPGMKQMAMLDAAAAYVKVGHPAFVFERAWLDKLLEGRNNLRIIDASDDAGSDASDDAGSEANPARVGDPHIWLSARGGRSIATNVARGLAALLPQHAAEFSANLRSLHADIDALDAHCREVLGKRRGQTFYTVHAAWGYLAADFGLRQVALEHGAKHADAHHLHDLVAEARAKGARRILVQTQFDPAAGKLLADEIGGNVITVDPLSRSWLRNMYAVADAIAGALSP